MNTKPKPKPKPKQWKLTSEEIEHLIGSGLRYGAFVMWCQITKPHEIINKVEELTGTNLEELADASRDEDKTKIESILNKVGKIDKLDFMSDVMNVYYKDPQMWYAENTFLQMDHEKVIYDQSKYFFKDMQQTILGLVEEHGSIMKYLDSLENAETSQS
tara:strand:- start:490 stop:966 length:477 start_codon:yes stop_codon:yes gene_type:complete